MACGKEQSREQDSKTLGCRVRYCRKFDVMSELTTTELTLTCMQGVGLF